MPPPKSKKELQTFLIIRNYLSKFSPANAKVHEQFYRVTSVETGWSWNTTYYDLFDRAKSIIKEDACMKFNDETKLLYLETDASRVGLEAGLLKVKDGMNCTWYQTPDNTIFRTKHLPVKTYPAQKDHTVTLKEKHLNTTWARKLQLILPHER